MKTASHILMGNFLCGYLKKQYGIYLDKNAFVWGNILPDCTLSFLKKPHTLKNYAAYIRRKIERLQSRTFPSVYIDKDRSKQLGILCHYYTDFFCHAHGPHFEGGLAAHIRYENRLHEYFVGQLGALEKIGFFIQPQRIEPPEVYAQFERLHSRYISSHISYGNDIVYSILGCVEALALLTGATAKMQEISSPVRSAAV